MLLVVKAETSIKDLVIDYIDVICASGKTISLNWEQSDVSKTSTGFYAEYLGVCFDDKLAKGQLSELREMHVDVIGLHSEQEGKLDIDVKEMCFYEDEKELIFSNPFQTEDNDACTDFKINLEKFIKALVGESYEKELDAFLKEEDEGGLYDISYDIKSLIEVNEFNPFTDEEKETEDYELAFDDWYDCFIESTIFPILKSIAYNRKEGRR